MDGTVGRHPVNIVNAKLVPREMAYVTTAVDLDGRATNVLFSIKEMPYKNRYYELTCYKQIKRTSLSLKIYPHRIQRYMYYLYLDVYQNNDYKSMCINYEKMFKQ